MRKPEGRNRCSEFRSRLTPLEFRTIAVQRVSGGRSAWAVARELGISHKSLRNRGSTRTTMVGRTVVLRQDANAHPSRFAGTRHGETHSRLIPSSRSVRLLSDRVPADTGCEPHLSVTPRADGQLPDIRRVRPPQRGTVSACRANIRYTHFSKCFHRRSPSPRVQHITLERR